ncbi:transcriptional regulator%2C luxR family [Mycobacterium tuberculosis]|nr:transcriptional regulator%2C luxR family [Mycobacterium tuberculosis]
MATTEHASGLTTLSELFERCRGGDQQIAVVTGAVGVGKTRLAHAFAEHTLAEGALLCEATASRVERNLQFGVLSQLFLCPALPAGIRERAAGQLAVRTVLTPWDGADPLGAGDEEIVSGVAHNLSALILDLFAETGRTLVLAVDDAQHADHSSLRALSSVANRLRRAPMFLLVSAADGPQPFDPAFLAELPPAPRCSCIRLAPLGSEAVAATLAEAVGEAAAELHAPECLRLSGGNPALLRGLIEDLRHHPAEAPGAELPLGPETAQALRGVLHRSDPALLSAAQWLALMGEQTPSATTARLAGMDRGTMDRMLALLEQGGVLADGAFRDPLLRKAVLDGLPAEARAEMHAAAAQALWLEGSKAPVIADHLLLAGGQDGSWAAAVLNDAAEQALAGGETASALGYLRLAHGLAPDETSRAATRSVLSRAAWRIDPALAMRHHGQPRPEAPDGLAPDGSVLSRVSGLLWFGRAEEAHETIRRAAALGGDDRRYRARLDAQRAWSSLLFPGRAEATAADALARRFRLGGAAGGPTDVAVSLIVNMLSDAGGEAAAAAERTLHEFRLEERTLPLLLSALGALIFGGRLAEAAKWAGSLQREAAGYGAPTWNALFTAARALTALRQGDVALAETQAREALDLTSAGSWGVAAGLPLSVLLQADTAMGRYGEALDHLRVPVPDAMFETPFGLLYLQAQGRVHYAREDFGSALRDFRTVGRLAAEFRMDYPALVSWRTDAAFTHLRMDESEAARELVNEQLSRLTPRHARERGISLRVLAACSDLSKRPMRLSQAVKELQVGGDRLELAYTLADLGVAYRALGEISQARRISQRAYQIARQYGARALTGALLPQTDAVMAAEESQGTKHASALSQAERRVAALAADGYTNRQIAEKLFITVSTVEQHLTKVYSKLKVTRRHDLPFGLHREATGPVLRRNRRGGPSGPSHIPFPSKDSERQGAAT